MPIKYGNGTLIIDVFPQISMNTMMLLVSLTDMCLKLEPRPAGDCVAAFLPRHLHDLFLLLRLQPLLDLAQRFVPGKFHDETLHDRLRKPIEKRPADARVGRAAMQARIRPRRGRFSMVSKMSHIKEREAYGRGLSIRGPFRGGR